MDLRADCSRCFGLCCVALPFARSVDFGIDKAAGDPCPKLREDYGCSIHARLREEGFRGCSVFDCFGAGQKVSQVTFGGRSWREDESVARSMFEVFPVMRQLHELLWYLTEAAALVEAEAESFAEAAAEADSEADSEAEAGAEAVREDLERLRNDVEVATKGDPASLASLDVGRLRRTAGPLLVTVSELVRSAHVPGRRQDRRRADLAGAGLAGADLRGADLRSAWLIAADLTGADLRWADLLGADVRDADLSGADLGGALFLTRPQLDAARGDSLTRLPRSLERPAHWA